jgi:hypothetical protein
MKGRPIEARHLRADLRRQSRERRAARGEQREVIGARDQVHFRRRGQFRFDEIPVPPVGRSPVVFGLPQLHRRLYRSQIGGGKGVAGRGSGDDRRLDALIMDPDRGRRVAARADGGHLLLPPRLAPPLLRVLMSERVQAGKLRVAADRDEHGKAACRMAERSDTRRCDVFAAGPCSQQVVDREPDVAGAFDGVARREAVGAVAPVVAGMGQRGSDEAGLGERSAVS